MDTFLLGMTLGLVGALLAVAWWARKAWDRLVLTPR